MRLKHVLLRAAANYLCEVARRQDIGGVVPRERVDEIGRMKLAVDEAASRASDVEQIVNDLVERCVVQGRRLSQAVPYGSTNASFDSSEAELLTRSIELDVDGDALVPVSFFREVACPETGLTVEVEFQLRSITPASLSSGRFATYAVSSAVPSHC